jgi:hypothetical protein
MAANIPNNTGNKVAGVAAPSLNVYKQIAIIRNPNDRVTYEDAEGNTKALSIQDLGPSIHVEVCAASRSLVLDDVCCESGPRC